MHLAAPGRPRVILDLPKAQTVALKPSSCRLEQRGCAAVAVIRDEILNEIVAGLLFHRQDSGGRGLQRRAHAAQGAEVHILRVLGPRGPCSRTSAEPRGPSGGAY